MRPRFVKVLLLLALLPAFRIASSQAALSVEGLRCEYLINPLGIDVVKPRLSWGLTPGPRGRRQTAYQVLVAGSPESLQKHEGDLWDSGKVNSDRDTFIAYQGRPLVSGMRCYWKVRVWDQDGSISPWSSPALWSMGILDESEWHGRWIGAARPPGLKEGSPLPSPWLRKTITLPQKPRQAAAYVNALGYYELYINGKKVDDYVLTPAVSDYSKRNLYVTHDIASYLSKGDNCIALWLGRGWYVRGHPGVVHDGPLVRAQFDLKLPDGSIVKLGTDTSWKVRQSPITPLGKGTAFGDYGGEHYDARLEAQDWNSVKLDDSSWARAAQFDPPRVRTAAQMVEPNRIIETIKPVKVEESPAGAWLIDMGKNYTGWLELHLPAGIDTGRKVRIEYADDTPSGGRFMTFNQRDEYVTRAGAGQIIRSRFNYHAFRYAHVTGPERAPALQDIKGYFIRTSYEPSGDFESSDSLLNRIYRTATWTYQCLTLGGYVVDCPTRERLGYGGDAGTSIETGMFNFDTGGLYNRWFSIWQDAQDPQTGDLPYTAPAYPDQGGGGPMWSGFVVTLPWQLYLQYGDKGILDTAYPTIQKWLAFAESKTKDHILEPYISYGIRMPQWNYLGDWVTPEAGRRGSEDPARNPISARFINNCHYLYTLELASRIAAVLGRKNDSSNYADKAEVLRHTLHGRFFDAAKDSYATGEQPYLALALLLDIAPQKLRAPVMKNLENTIRVKNSGHIDAGMHGTYFLLKELMADDRNDLIYQMASQKTFPGWGYMLEQGATTFWESWTGGSHIHDTLISIGSWFIQGIGGIRIDEKSPGFHHFFIEPSPAGDLRFARTHYRSIHGMIVSNWRIENGRFFADVTVPPGTAATLLIPASDPASVTESGLPAGQSTGVRANGMEKGRAAFELESGRYRFESRLSR